MAKMEPQELAFADLAPFTIEASAIIPTSATAVFAVLKDHHRWPDWIGSGFTSVESTSDPDYGVGSTRTVTVWRVAKVEERFVGWQEPTLWAFTATSLRPGVLSKLVERFEIEPEGDDRCRVSYRAGCDFPPFLRPFAGIIVRLLARPVGPALERLSQEALRRAELSADG